MSSELLITDDAGLLRGSLGRKSFAERREQRASLVDLLQQIFILLKFGNRGPRHVFHGLDGRFKIAVFEDHNVRTRDNRRGSGRSELPP
jgi:hypothetical protein